ncbi:MAG: hypothetical protein ACP5UT_05985, partial [Bryobacteraceae bacterium]
MKQPVKVVPMPSIGTATGTRKAVPCTQEAIDALPPNSGDWRVQGVPGLYVRAGASSKTFRVQRRVSGKLAVRVLGQMSAA